MIVVVADTSPIRYLVRIGLAHASLGLYEIRVSALAAATNDLKQACSVVESRLRIVLRN